MTEALPTLVTDISSGFFRFHAFLGGDRGEGGSGVGTCLRGGQSLWSDLSTPQQRDVQVMVAPLDVLVEVYLGGEGKKTMGAGEHLSLGRLYILGLGR